jgi:hypothetical protein
MKALVETDRKYVRIRVTRFVEQSFADTARAHGVMECLRIMGQLMGFRAQQAALHPDDEQAQLLYNLHLREFQRLCFSFSVDNETLERLRGYSKQTRIPPSIVIREAIKDWISDEGRGTIIRGRVEERRAKVESDEIVDTDQLFDIQLGLSA